MPLSSREFRLALRFLLIGYVLGYLGIVNTIYLIVGYVIYKLLGFDLKRIILKLFLYSGEVWAILYNKVAEYKESPGRVSAENFNRIADRIQNFEFYAKLIEIENRLIEWLDRIQHRRVGEIFGIDMDTVQLPKSPIVSSSIQILPISPQMVNLPQIPVKFKAT